VEGSGEPKGEQQELKLKNGPKFRSGKGKNQLARWEKGGGSKKEKKGADCESKQTDFQKGGIEE